MSLKDVISDFDKEFEEEFPLGGEVWVLERHLNEVKTYLKRRDQAIIEAVIEEERKRIKKQIIKWMDKNYIHEPYTYNRLKRGVNNMLKQSKIKVEHEG
jgi:AraC-like DNA-binding protein